MAEQNAVDPETTAAAIDADRPDSGSVSAERIVGGGRIDGQPVDSVSAGSTADSEASRDSEDDESPPTGPRRVLIALCRPFAGGDPWARPATNKDIAAELFLSVAAVKTHLRALFGRFGIEDLGQNEKRLRLAELAFQAGLVSMEDVQGQSNHPLGP